MGLNTSERALIQAMIGAGALPEKKMASLFNKIVDEVKDSRGLGEDGSGLTALSDRINGALRAYDMQLAAAVVPERGVWWGLVNTARDDAALLGSVFSTAELQMFHSVVDLLRENGGTVPLTDAHNVAPSCKLRVADGARAIEKLAAQQWLHVARLGHGRGATTTVTFGARAMLELPDIRMWWRDHVAGSQTRPRQEDDDDSEEDEIAPLRRTRAKLLNGKRARLSKMKLETSDSN